MNQHQINLIDAIIIRAVEVDGPIRGTQLASAAVVASFNDPELKGIDHANVVMKRIYELVEEGRIIEIEYQMPGIEPPIKSIFLPSGSWVSVVSPTTEA